jgi:iron complex outermembrane receptor protein
MSMPTQNTVTRTLRGVVTATLLLASAGASAQQAAASEGLEEIIVTATKKANAIIDTPAAISAITAEQMGAGGIEDVSDLATAVPSLSVGDQFGVNRTFIRGVGMTSIDLGADGAVAFLQDGAMIARPSAQLSGFYDLEQVEVLRGPQGTTYGRGATAGVINLVTRKPGKELNGYARLTGGNYSAKTFEGAVGGPVSDTVGARLAVKWDQRDGYGKNLFTGSQIDNRDAIAVRGMVSFAPSDNVSATLIADYFKEDDNNYAFHYFGTTATPENSLAHNILGGKTIFDYYADRNQTPDLRNIYSDQDPVNTRHGTGVTALVDFTLGEWDVKSVTAWRDFTRYTRDDLDVSDVNMFGQNNYDEQSTALSQEFTFSRTAGKWELLGGAMFFHEKLFGSVKVPLTNFAALVNVLNAANPLWVNLPNGALNSLNYWQLGTVKTDAYGAFLQGTYAINDQLKLTVGGRYNREKRAGSGSFIFDALGVNVPTDKGRTWDALTPKFLLEYNTAGGQLWYGSLTRGFKSGVINVGSQNDVIDPEYVWSTEVGVKGKAANGNVEYRVAGFYYKYTNLQVGFVDANSVVTTVNAASARNYGLEVELRARLAEGLTADFYATLLDATYQEFTTGDYRNGFAQVDVSGNRLQNAPPATAFAGLTYETALGSGTLALRAEASYQGKVYFTEFNNADAAQDSYTIGNVSAVYTDGSGHWSVGGWVKNVGDEYIISNNIITAPLYGSIRVGSVAPPRTYGVTVGYKF